MERKRHVPYVPKTLSTRSILRIFVSYAKCARMCLIVKMKMWSPSVSPACHLRVTGPCHLRVGQAVRV
eukprot:7004981-Pyramimonas_sp.AAC.1